MTRKELPYWRFSEGAREAVYQYSYMEFVQRHLMPPLTSDPVMEQRHMGCPIGAKRRTREREEAAMDNDETPRDFPSPDIIYVDLEGRHVIERIGVVKGYIPKLRLLVGRETVNMV